MMEVAARESALRDGTRITLPVTGDLEVAIWLSPLNGRSMASTR
jgi:hypothetical protein